MRTSIAVAGEHMLSNALLAAAAGHELGMTVDEIGKGLEQAVLTSGRLRQYESGGVQVIDDTYNANPESVIAGLETLAALPGEERRTAVLGMMAELGGHAGEAYPRIGKRAEELGLRLVTAGPEADAYGAENHFEDRERAAAWLSQNTASGERVLFKGSRMAAMERIMNSAFPE